MRYQEQANSQKQKPPGTGEEGAGSYCSMGAELLPGVMESSGNEYW